MTESKNSKTAAIKTLAIIGFFATIGLLVWLLIQGLRVMPGAFSSLASIAESLQNYQASDELSIATEKSIVVSGESFKVTWTDLRRDGTYEFAYSCIPGIKIEIRGGEGDLITIPCAETLSLPQDVQGLFVSISSETERFVDVPFSVTFKKNSGDVVVASDAQVTVVNATIPVAEETTEPVATTTPEKPVVGEAPKPEVKSTTPAVTKPVVKPTTPAPVVTYVPQSNPNGFTDLKMTYLGVGEMNGNTFTAKNVFDRSERAGLKFEVKNIGTKTSGTWTFTAVLPGDVVYESEPQIALKPNERVEFTLGFDLDSETNAKTVTVKSTVFTKGDTNSKNDSFSWVVGVTK